MAASSRTAVVAAVFGNGTLTVLKFIAFWISGSGAMFAEAIHSFADTANQALLWAGLSRSRRPADRHYHYGYGGEQFLFALLAAVGIFVLGCGVTVYHGVHSLMHPAELEIGWLSFGVLGISFVVDGVVLATAVKAVNKQRGQQSFFDFLKNTTDPTVVAVLLEDLVATLGVLVALLCIGLAHWTGDARWDGIGSVLIGLMMGAIAVKLALMNRRLLLGHALSPEREAEVQQFLEAQPSVEVVRSLRTRVIATGQFKLQADLDFDGTVIGKNMSGWIKERLPKNLDPTDSNNTPSHGEPTTSYNSAIETFSADVGEEVANRIALEVDRIERELQLRFPELKFMDLEAD